MSAASSELQEGTKQPLVGGRVAKTPGLNPENKCKWTALNKLYKPDDAEWQRAAAAPRWDSRDIVPRIRHALDQAWTIEQATMARRKAEEEKEMARVLAQHERVQQRYEENQKIREFAQEKGLVIVHERETPKEPDALAETNPLSTGYLGRRTRDVPSKSPSPSPSPDPQLAQEAAKFNILLVPRSKKKREELRTAAAKSVEEAEKALDRLTPEQLKELLEKRMQEKKAEKRRAKPAASGAAGAEEKSGGGDPDAARKEAFYQAKLKEITEAREGSGAGKLSKASRAQLRQLCCFHYKDGQGERGFAGSALVTPWDAQFKDVARHPAASEDETDSD